MPLAPKPAFSDGLVTLYRGDALRILPHLRFDHCITDPPYESHMHVSKLSARRVRTDGYASPKPVNFASIDGLRERFTPLIKGRCSGWFMAFCTPEGIAPWRDSIEAAGLRYKRACFFYKPDSAPQFNGQGPAFAVEAFVTAWCGKGVSKWNGGGRRNLWTANTNNSEREGTHPTEKPIELMMDLIRLFTNLGDTICDPFMGSGSTVIAAAALGRKVIGIEKDAATFKLARHRLVAALSMGKDEGRRYLTQRMGRAEPPGPLFQV